jgi:hypothetical protein
VKRRSEDSGAGRFSFIERPDVGADVVLRFLSTPVAA